MRSFNILRGVGIIAFLTSNGNMSYAESTISKMAPPSLSVSVDVVEDADVKDKRLLRREGGDNVIDEERGLTWLTVKGWFPGTAQNMAAKAAKEEKKIKFWAPVFAKFKDKEPLDIYTLFRADFYTEKQAMKMGLRFEKYMKNRAAYD